MAESLHFSDLPSATTPLRERPSRERFVGSARGLRVASLCVSPERRLSEPAWPSPGYFRQRVLLTQLILASGVPGAMGPERRVTGTRDQQDAVPVVRSLVEPCAEEGDGIDTTMEVVALTAIGSGCAAAMAVGVRPMPGPG